MANVLLDVEGEGEGEVTDLQGADAPVSRDVIPVEGWRNVSWP